MQKIADYGNGIEIWRIGDEFFVFGVTAGGDARVCPSEGMAREVAAGATPEPFRNILLGMVRSVEFQPA